ncbi:TolC family protein [Chondrinema litorale]|uniref:TolC family protein n=1 Tax=Chondrinema litorale TaxID=2994555 RepID=UPI002543B2F2|nr:TolC family protein [Chondrinema litorale]UZR93021.1 TolC family protein [Chondrinema litorale]
MRYRSSVICLLLFACIQSSLMAQDVKLENYLRQAADNHPALQAGYKRWQASLERVPQAAALPDPSVSLGYFILPVETRLGPQRVKLSVNQQFPWFGTLKARKDLASQQAALEYAKFESLKNDLFFDVRKLYYEIYGISQQISLRKNMLEIQKSMENIALEAYKNDLQNLSEVLKLQMDIRENETAIQNLKADLSSNYILLSEKTGQRPSQNQQIQLSVADTLQTSPLLFTLEVLQGSARNSNPKAFAMLQDVSVEDKAFSVAKQDSKAKIGTGLDYGILGQRTDANPENNGRDILMPMVSVSIPIFNKEKYQAQQQEVVLKKESKQSDYEAFINQLEAEIAKAWTEYKNADRNLKLIQEQQETLSQIERLTTSRYSNTEAGYNEILTVKLAKIKLDLDKAKLSVQLAVAKAKLQQLCGIERL